MTELLTAAQMRAIEQAAMEAGGVTGLTLMERAGRGVLEAILDEWPDWRHAPQSVCVLCGPGNNGGDGFVIAQLLHARGWGVRVLAGEAGAYTPPDALENRQRWESLGPILPLDRAGLEACGDASLYVDAVFGTGLARPVSDDLAALLSCLAGSGGDHGFFQPRLVAVDVPSGLCADSGTVLGCPEPDPFKSLAPYARLTVTFETPKPGHFLADGPALCGRLVVKDIGLARWRSLNKDGHSLRLAKLLLVPALKNGPREPHVRHRPTVMPKRAGHKYDHGHVVVATGGMGKTGAARLAARGALRMGAGLVTLAAPGNAMQEVAGQITALMLKRADTGDAMRALLEDARLDVVALGPGLGLDGRACDLLQAVLDASPPPPAGTYAGQGRRLVLDADALTLLARRDAPFAGLGAHVVLTPHMGEFKRLFPQIAARLSGPSRPPLPRYQDGSPAALAEFWTATKTYQEALRTQTGPAYSKVDAVREAAALSGAVVLLKGPDTVVADPMGRAFIHAAVYDRAAPWLATAGAGDVLTGFIAGLMARKHMPHEAAILGAWLHVDCARRFGPGLIAEDLPEALPEVLRAMAL